ncbi:MAG TPA: UDP-N-acetylmuramate dehydrogenase [Atribacter sp.]|jgi:UDP-N-acetylmuramate dehydrogenase|uniref:UDP-N-acetylmuramate dehydrogenase n=1 Tax=Atribacter sp. TaxID=2847780 RepID=UPI00175DABA4|nr:UDP-N-acetylmuramate dehydrogenase [Atribacter sp.]HHT10471.1 UDP-N-acetylmuramate dehydrogenase [Candidatus Atribacteria bacterium]HQK83195.1 UDP-N-acetylmuramate dehydrogenase [Atribacter sp.]
MEGSRQHVQEKWKSIEKEYAGSPDLIVAPQAEMKFYTTWKIGGRVIALVDVLRSVIFPNLFFKMQELDCPWKILGKGSNILVSDQGYSGVVIRLAGEYSEMNYLGNHRIESGAGVALSHLVSFALGHSLGGFEFLVGVPGTVGGAVRINAGCFGQEISNLIQEILVMDNNGNIEWLKREKIDFFYRGSSLKKDRLTILKVIFQLFSDKSENIRNNVRRYSLLRKQFQPVGWPSAGCVFKNPPGDYAAKIIDQMGFKGLRTGFAQISEKHSNFIINRGSAKARDVIVLIDWIRQEVQRERNIFLENEIEVWQ